MHRKSLILTFSATSLSILVYLFRPKRAQAPVIQKNSSTYPGSSILIQPGDLLFSPIGKRESKFIGHVGIVNHQKEVVHSIPAGLTKDNVFNYYQKFRSIKIYRPRSPEIGISAGDYVQNLYNDYSNADYRIMPPLVTASHQQYCTKIVWQAYYFGAGVNLGDFNGSAKAIHPELLKDRRFLRLVL
ncbi:YiiX/YebB-like N1pC/P60 family cysteine hydrolase [Halobacillus sp. BBL2006]|uniref:YiiX/YebB-like N1pC/P60 family cysteine hydrolase n=1 Tax=Halobacillus sp. BBL2006 TaxID=1543706 RepID=UPI000541DF47|nr:YiiX/YebB-like N1pC/P60 family cysteine hydrolase [Halobacillus sp. BBL2006]KHE67128.1 hypothetical protein LD39_19145 [Halobacillus sp. BBL2006]